MGIGDLSVHGKVSQARVVLALFPNWGGRRFRYQRIS